MVLTATIEKRVVSEEPKSFFGLISRHLAAKPVPVTVQLDPSPSTTAPLSPAPTAGEHIPLMKPVQAVTPTASTADTKKRGLLGLFSGRRATAEDASPMPTPEPHSIPE